MGIIWNKSGDDYTAKAGECELKVHYIKKGTYPGITDGYHWSVWRKSFLKDVSGLLGIPAIEEAQKQAEQAYLKQLLKIEK